MTAYTSATPPGSGDLGSKVSIRLVNPGGGFRDVLGILETPTSVRKSDGSLHPFNPQAIFAWRRILPRHQRAGSGAPRSLRIRELEDVLSRSWPALEVEIHNDWVLRASEGVSLRGNSGLIRSSGTLEDLARQIAETTDFYRTRNVRPALHVVLPDFQTIDQALESQGWSSQSETVVMVADRSEVIYAEREYEGIKDFHFNDSDFHIHTQPSEDWLEISEPKIDRRDVIRRIINGIPSTYISYTNHGRTIGVARATQVDDWVILSKVFVSEVFRNQGIAAAMIGRILASHNAPFIALQVERENEAAIALYQKLGFREHHHYRYRVLRELTLMSDGCC